MTSAPTGTSSAELRPTRTGMEFVTSVNQAYFEKYGLRLVSSFLEFAPADARLTVYCEASAEGVPLESYSLPDGAPNRVALVDLYETTSLSRFLDRAVPIVEGRLGCPVDADPDARRKTPGYDYNWDAVTFAKKAFAMNHTLTTSSARYCFWIDSDIVFLAPVSESFLVGLFEGGDVVYFGRKRPHMEGGFSGYDLASERTQRFVHELNDLWDGLGLLSLEDGWTDCHAFDHVLRNNVADGSLRAINLSREAEGHVISSSALSPYLDHIKGDRKLAGSSPERDLYLNHRVRWWFQRRLRYWFAVKMKGRAVNVAKKGLAAVGLLEPVRRRMGRGAAPAASRYSQIDAFIRNVRPESILEVGVWNGLRALELAKVALVERERVEYLGFDLFELMTPEISEDEMNVKPVPSEAEVAERLSAFAAENPGFSFKLHKGFTKDTLPRFVEERGEGTVDFVWLDGGHAVETIESDWANCRRAVRSGGMILLDDYYTDVPESTLERFGCNRLVERLRGEGLEVDLLPIRDEIVGGGRTQIAAVRIP